MASAAAAKEAPAAPVARRGAATVAMMTPPTAGS